MWMKLIRSQMPDKQQKVVFYYFVWHYWSQISVSPWQGSVGRLILSSFWWVGLSLSLWYLLRWIYIPNLERLRRVQPIPVSTHNRAEVNQTIRYILIKAQKHRRKYSCGWANRYRYTYPFSLSTHPIHEHPVCGGIRFVFHQNKTIN